MSSHWRRFVSWNSSTRTERKRQLSRSRIVGWSRSRSRAFSWRSSKSSADSASFAAAYASAKRRAAPREARGRAPRARRARPARRAARLLGSRTARGPAPGGEVGEVDQPLGAGGRSSSSSARRALQGRLGLLHPGRVLDHAPRRLASSSIRSSRAGRSASSRTRLTARRAQRLVDAGQHPSQPPRAVGGEQPIRSGSPRAELLERLLERLAGEHPRLVLVEHAEARVDAGLEGMRLQQALAEAVDRRDPGAVELAREIVAAELGEPRRIRPRSSPAARSV